MGFTLCYHTSFTIYLPLFLSLSSLFGALNFGETRKLLYDHWKQMCFYLNWCLWQRKQLTPKKENSNPSPPSKIKTPMSYMVNTNSVYIRDSEHPGPLNSQFRLNKDAIKKKVSYSKSIPKVLQLIGVAGTKQSLSQSSEFKFDSSTISEVTPTKLNDPFMGSKSLNTQPKQTELALKFNEPNSVPSPRKKLKIIKEESLHLLEHSEHQTSNIKPMKKSRSLTICKDTNKTPKEHSVPPLYTHRSDGNIIRNKKNRRRIKFSDHKTNSNTLDDTDNDFVTLVDYNPHDRSMDGIMYLDTPEQKDSPKLLRLSLHIFCDGYICTFNIFYSTVQVIKTNDDNKTNKNDIEYRRRQSSRKHILNFLGENGFYTENDMNDVSVLQEIYSKKMVYNEDSIPM